MLRQDEIQEINVIAREIAKEEIEAMGKRPKELAKKLERVVTDLEAKITNIEIKVKELERNTIDLKAEIKKALQAAPAHVEISKRDKRR